MVGTPSLRSWHDTEGNSKGLTDKESNEESINWRAGRLRGVQQGEGRVLPEPRAGNLEKGLWDRSIVAQQEAPG